MKMDIVCGFFYYYIFMYFLGGQQIFAVYLRFITQVVLISVCHKGETSSALYTGRLSIYLSIYLRFTVYHFSFLHHIVFPNPFFSFMLISVGDSFYIDSLFRRS